MTKDTLNQPCSCGSVENPHTCFGFKPASMSKIKSVEETTKQKAIAITVRLETEILKGRFSSSALEGIEEILLEELTTLLTPKPTPEVEEIPKFYSGGNALAKGEVVVTYKDHLAALATLTTKHQEELEKAVETERLKHCCCVIENSEIVESCKLHADNIEKARQEERERILMHGILIKSLKRVGDKLWVELDTEHQEIGDALTVINTSRLTPTKTDKQEADVTKEG